MSLYKNTVNLEIQLLMKINKLVICKKHYNLREILKYFINSINYL